MTLWMSSNRQTMSGKKASVTHHGRYIGATIGNQ